ncbi:hypothetical protein RB653_002002 [Dictyostelium firmibasis]|uniref:Proteasome assembly chaperone 2 n=1 Tax=Dictyostelium firmibasis TaxID=79012 RepID=A0AAN7U2C6_9MYCE
MSKFFYSIDNSSISFKNHTLIWPSLTLGNIGQLTIDVLICSFEFKRIGFIADENIVPIIGNDCFTTLDSNNGIMSTSIEVYQSSIFPSITLVQQRSPIIDGRIPNFSENLLNWISAEQFKEILFLSSSNANKRVDSQLTGSQVRFIKSENVDKKTISKLSEMNIPEMELTVQSPEGETIQLSNRLTGLAKEIYSIINNNNNKYNVSFLCLNLFCSEGYNTNEALQMSNLIYNFIKNQDSSSTPQLKTPSCWKLLQGPTFDQSLFF